MRVLQLAGVTPFKKSELVLFNQHFRQPDTNDRLRSPNFRSLINENILGECFRNS